jgi:hypothetical protein
MYPTGQPDPATLINLGQYDPRDYLTRAQRSYLEGGARPGTFFRDLGTASNQVPQLVWLLVGSSLLGLGYYVYRKQSKSRRGA